MKRVMSLRGFLRGGVRSDPDHVVRLTGLLFFCGGLVGILSIALPQASGADHTGLAITIATALALGAALAAFPRRIPLAALQPLIFAGSVMIAAGVYFTGTADSPYPMMYIWTTLFAAYLFERRWALGQVVWLLATYGVALALLPGDAESSSVTRWLLTAIALGIAAMVTSWLVARAHAAEEHAGRFFEISQDLLCTANREGFLVDVNDAWRTHLGYDLDELRAMPYRDLAHPDDRAIVEARLGSVFGGVDVTNFELRVRDSRGRWHWVAWTATYSPAQRLVYARGTDVTERRRMLDELKSQARTDPLTGLPNRRWLAQELDREMARTRRKSYPLSVAMLDVDHFKRFNDVCGHPAGDRFLREAADGWRGALRASDFMARYGGEEFVLVLPDCDTDQALEIAERVRAATPLEQTCSAGIATWTGDESQEVLIQRADGALYQAKAEGRDRSVAARTV